MNLKLILFYLCIFYHILICKHPRKLFKYIYWLCVKAQWVLWTLYILTQCATDSTNAIKCARVPSQRKKKQKLKRLINCWGSVKIRLWASCFLQLPSYNEDELQLSDDFSVLFCHLTDFKQFCLLTDLIQSNKQTVGLEIVTRDLHCIWWGSYLY